MGIFMDNKLEQYNNLIGLTLEEAEKISGKDIRPRKVDGKSMVGTVDYRLTRLNVEIENNKITKILGLG